MISIYWYNSRKNSLENNILSQNIRLGALKHDNQLSNDVIFKNVSLEKKHLIST